MTAAKGLPSSADRAAEILDILFKMINAWNDELQPQFGS